MNNLQDYSVVALLPESLKVDPFIIALAEAIEIELKEAYREAESMSDFSDVEKLPEALLDYLAHQKHVDFYENNLPIKQKQALVKNSTEWHRRKGTTWAVEQVVSVVFRNAKINEWFEYEGNPYLFRIETEESLSSENDLNRLVRMIDSTKNKRSRLESITIKRQLNSSLSFGGIISTRSKIQIGPAAFKMPNLYHGQHYAGFISTRSITTIQEVR